MAHEVYGFSYIRVRLVLLKAMVYTVFIYVVTDEPTAPNLQCRAPSSNNLAAQKEMKKLQRRAEFPDPHTYAGVGRDRHVRRDGQQEVSKGLETEKLPEMDPIYR